MTHYNVTQTCLSLYSGCRSSFFVPVGTLKTHIVVRGDIADVVFLAPQEYTQDQIEVSLRVEELAYGITLEDGEEILTLVLIPGYYNPFAVIERRSGV